MKEPSNRRMKKFAYNAKSTCVGRKQIFIEFLPV